MVNSGKDKRVRGVRGAYPHDKDDALEQAAKDRDMIAKYSARFGIDAQNEVVKEVIKEVEVEKIIEVRTPKDKALIANLETHISKCEEQLAQNNSIIGEHIENFERLYDENNKNLELNKNLNKQLETITNNLKKSEERAVRVSATNDKLQAQNTKLKKALTDDEPT